MKLLRMLLSVALVGCLAGVAYVRQLAEPTGAKMTTAASKFLATLTPDQRAKINFGFDDKERFNWYFVPRQDEKKQPTRKGLPLEEMTKEQKEAARDLLRSGTSAEGFTKAITIMSLEAILHELEKPKGAMVRNPEWYFFAVFGNPSKTGKWGWRVEGHHLALNFTVDGGRIIGATPAFFGANPATVMDGPRKGLRTLPLAEDLAKELFKSLDEGQRKAAHQDEQFPEIEQAKSAPNVGEPTGLVASKMTEKQRGLLMQLLEAYTNRMPADIAEAQLAALKQAGVEKIHFAYAGGTKPGEPHSYRVYGPTFLVEFLNVQADSAKHPANHIHSVWRNLKGDFGTAG